MYPISWKARKLECWKDVHPGLVTIPVNWDYAIPFGLLYPLNPLPDVKHFVKVVKEFPTSL